MNSWGFIKGMTMGIAVGACVTMAFDPISDKQRRRMHKKTDGFFKNVGNIIDSAICLVKQ